MPLTTPERRLSLLLKQQELQQGESELCAALGALIEQPSIDLLDESDELLSHRYVGAGGWVLGGWVLWGVERWATSAYGGAEPHPPDAGMLI